MITLVPKRLHWVKDDGCDDPLDLCVHSPVHFEIDGQTFVDAHDGDFTVSATAIYLLRTLAHDHSKANPVGEHLFPCCGHAIFDTGDDDVLICGCSNGLDISVVHNGDGTICLRKASGETSIVTEIEWRNAVRAFSDLVRRFYDDSLPKTPPTTDTGAYAKMMAEWDRRRNEK